jgi:DNA repair protein RadD
MTFTLRDYQHKAVRESVEYLLNPRLKGRHGIVIAPTGAGKSLIIANVLAQLDGPAIVFQPTREILEQNAAKLVHYGYHPAVFSASFDRREIGQITLATIGTAISHPHAFERMQYVLIDECHQSVSPKGGMYLDFLQALPHVRILGFTATPFRLASNSFGSQLRFLTRTSPRLFRDVVHITQIDELRQGGYWTELRYHEPSVIKRERLRMNSTGSDYTDASVQLLFAEVGFVGRLIDEVQTQLAAGRKHVLVFTRFVDEARRLADAIPGAAYVTGETSANERASIIRQFKSGVVPVVANVGVLGLGFDFPELDCVVLARPSVSLSTYYQQVGRAVRPHASKSHADIVDMVGLVRLFGKVEDLQVQPGGFSGQQWVVSSHGRALTNCYFSDRDGVPDAPPDPKAISAQKKRAYWAKRRRFGR